ncbi:tripartite tricarboxylate transporter substrate binding protein [Siccirubricoccus sp. KC 17139]|uniref:Tripartite tricarboxylate transporter substrate binding protein n=1 Tax=Siccirubricoccus soli TaxID=2899147 RepID=A0ABT1CZ76_9PROT|nr:tripartite tricarboxylate transporter substrate binding protein [Siccirubricoccus soli]MCO6414949.1 tripartite tricarboxylate transporter substrate binding protein [Siccirubricoccus soli]MCP2681080.1 tripartite tricarboxylate transporter substrate binding protein [Siccirubricoccus soli]
MPRAMRPGRRAALGLALAAPALAIPARAQGPLPWPVRGIRLVVPFGPGGPTDVMARALSHGLPPVLGQPVVVESRPGGGGNIGVAHVARAAPDGDTLLVTSTGFVVNPSLFRNPGYDPVRDFAPITELGASPNVLLARPDSGIESVAALVARAKAEPGVLNMANPGTGSTPHLTIELLRLKTGIEVVQVPHNSAALAIQSLLGGTTSIGVTALPPAQPQIKAGALRALALTGASRWPDLPEVPTMQELGYEGFVSETFQGLLAPAGTPAAILARLTAAAREVLAAPQIAARLRAAGFELRLAGPQALADRIVREVPLWREVIRAAGLPQE